MTYLLCTVKQHKKENGNLYLRSKDNQGTSPGAIEKIHYRLEYTKSICRNTTTRNISNIPTR